MTYVFEVDELSGDPTMRISKMFECIDGSKHCGASKCLSRKHSIKAKEIVVGLFELACKDEMEESDG